MLTPKQNFKLAALATFFLFALGPYFYPKFTKLQIKKEPILGSQQPAILGESVTFTENPILENPKPYISFDLEKLAKIKAKSFLIFNEDTGEDLLEKSSAEKMGIASLTKLLTALVAYNKLSLTEEIQITAKDRFSVYPRIGLEPGDTVTGLDLISAMIISSANDAAVSLANHTEKSTGRKFNELMNEAAKELEMNNSNFNNPLGFDSKNNYSTAQDLKKLVKATQNLGLFRLLGRKKIYSFQDKYASKKFTVNTTNKLLSTTQNLEAIKTGYTENSLGSMIVRIEVNNTKYIIIVLGSKNREQDVLLLLNLLQNALEL